jgi:hypothetical protein
MNTKIKYEENLVTFDMYLGILMGGAVFITLANIVMIYKGIRKHKNNYKL